MPEPFIDAENHRLGAYFVRFDSEDTDGERFRDDCGFELRDGDERPAYWHHTFSEAHKAKPTVVGRWSDFVRDKVGMFGVLTLSTKDELAKTAKRIVAYAKAGRLGFSSGSAPHLMRKDGEGGITYWPVAEISPTTRPTDWATVMPGATKGQQPWKSQATFMPDGWTEEDADAPLDGDAPPAASDEPPASGDVATKADDDPPPDVVVQSVPATRQDAGPQRESLLAELAVLGQQL